MVSDSDNEIPESQTGLQPSGEPLATVDAILDCWNRIGVEGDGTCPELEHYTHCRNCPVYSNAGSRLLRRTLPQGYRQEWTEHYAVMKTPAPGAKISAIIFRLGSAWLALPTQTFQEVTEQRPIHSIPHRGDGVVLGLVNVRGELLVCVSVARVLDLDQGASLEKLRSYYNRLLVFLWEGSRLTCPADEVQGIYRLHPTEVARPAMLNAKEALAFTQGVFAWRQKMVGLLDPQLLFSALNRSFA
jgi:chemotaxis-related protein WspD